MQQSNPVGVFILHIKINQLHQRAALSLGKTQYAHSEGTCYKDGLCVAGKHPSDLLTVASVFMLLY